MAFVYEMISDEDKQRIDFSKIKAGLRAVEPYKWVIDRKKDAFLVRAYPEREAPYEVWYAFWLQGKVYEVALVEQDGIRMPNGNLVVPVRIPTIFIPQGMQAPSAEVDLAVDEIRKAIEALIQAKADQAGWGCDIAQIQIEIEHGNKGAK